MYEPNPPDEAPLSIAPAAAAAAPALNPAAEFGARIAAITPDLYVARIILGINVAIFLAMLLKGVSPIEPAIDSLLRWGANFGPLTVGNGEWWRLVTCMFLHIGIIHIAFNMFVLWQIGPFVERLLGNEGFLVVYFVSGIAGALLSVAWHPYVVSAGASGAIFGLYGALLGFLCIRRDSIPTEVLSPLTKNALLFIGYNAIYGFARSGTDIGAHAGGLLGGFLCGLALSVPLTLDPRPRRTGRNVAVALAAAVLFTAVALKLPHPIDFQAQVKIFAGVEKSTLAAYSSALNRTRAEHLKDEQLAELIEKNVLPPWSAEHDRLAKLKGLPDPSQHLVNVLLQYMQGRQEAWTLLAQGLRQHDMARIRLAMQKQQEAQSLVQQLTTGRPAKP